MAETERDAKVSAGYRALGGEEPPRALDEAILAAARRRPSRWRVPLSIAAVLVLAVGVTLRMLPERPEMESVALAPQVMETPRPKAPAQAAAPAPASEPAAAADALREAPAPLRAEVAAEPESRTTGEVGGVRAAAAPPPAGAAQGMLAKKSEMTPEAWLVRIAELRKEGRMREAEESLAEFRKRYPDYRIPQALR